MATTGTVHYAPGDRPLCGAESWAASYTDDPALVAGCADCLELVAEYLGDDNEHWAHCLHCQQEISAQNGVEWPDGPPALPALRQGRMVKRSQIAV